MLKANTASSTENNDSQSSSVSPTTIKRLLEVELMYVNQDLSQALADIEKLKQELEYKNAAIAKLKLMVFNLQQTVVAPCAGGSTGNTSSGSESTWGRQRMYNELS